MTTKPTSVTATTTTAPNAYTRVKQAVKRVITNPTAQRVAFGVAPFINHALVPATLLGMTLAGKAAQVHAPNPEKSNANQAGVITGGVTAGKVGAYAIGKIYNANKDKQDGSGGHHLYKKG